MTLILHKSESEYQFSSTKEKINHLLFMDDLKLYAKNEKGRLVGMTGSDSTIFSVMIFAWIYFFSTQMLKGQRKY